MDITNAVISSELLLLSLDCLLFYMRNTTTLITIIDKVNSFFGSIASWATLMLVILIGIDVAMRYVANISFNWLLDLEWHVFSLIFLFGFGYTLHKDKHVRVDIFYQKWTPKNQKLVDRIGHLLLLMPWCFVLLSTSYRYFTNSLMMWEGSPEPGGLPARFFIKGAIVVSVILLCLQGLREILNTNHMKR